MVSGFLSILGEYVPSRDERKLMDKIETQVHSYADKVVGKQKPMPKNLQRAMQKDPKNGIRWVVGQAN